MWGRMRGGMYEYEKKRKVGIHGGKDRRRDVGV
jgi:hypothetical protein